MYLMHNNLTFKRARGSIKILYFILCVGFIGLNISFAKEIILKPKPHVDITTPKHEVVLKKAASPSKHPIKKSTHNPIKKKPLKPHPKPKVIKSKPQPIRHKQQPVAPFPKYVMMGAGGVHYARAPSSHTKVHIKGMGIHPWYIKKSHHAWYVNGLISYYNPSAFILNAGSGWRYLLEDTKQGEPIYSSYAPLPTQNNFVDLGISLIYLHQPSSTVANLGLATNLLYIKKENGVYLRMILPLSSVQIADSNNYFSGIPTTYEFYFIKNIRSVHTYFGGHFKNYKNEMYSGPDFGLSYSFLSFSMQKKVFYQLLALRMNYDNLKKGEISLSYGIISASTWAFFPGALEISS